MGDKIDAVIASMGWDLDPQEWADMRRLCEAALAQRPAQAVPEEQSLDARLEAAGMLTVSQLMQGQHIDSFIKHAKTAKSHARRMRALLAGGEA